jgi:2-methylcitrate dehydratase PrpD
VTEAAIPLICEPAPAKRRPASSYAAQFSLHYAIACGLLRGRYGLQEIEEGAYTDPQLLALADRVSYEIDPKSGFPKYRSGEVIVTLASGAVVSRRDNILPDEPASAEAIVSKFRQNVDGRLDAGAAQRLIDTIMTVEKLPGVAPLIEALA